MKSLKNKAVFYYYSEAINLQKEQAIERFCFQQGIRKQ